MIRWRRGEVVALGRSWPGAQELEARTADGATVRALAHPPLVGSPAQQRQRLLATLARWLIGLAAIQPAVLVVEDLMWADPSTIELDEAKVNEWLGKGAQPSDAVAKLIKAAGISTS